MTLALSSGFGEILQVLCQYLVHESDHIIAYRVGISIVSKLCFPVVDIAIFGRN